MTGPLYVGLACLPAAMHVYGLKLNYQEEGPGSLPHVVRTTGVATVVATLSNAAGYGALLTAGHPGLRSIGELALMGVACAFLGTTVLFPALLALFERRLPEAAPAVLLPLPAAEPVDEEPRRSV